jgi:hypothetical protein
MEKDLIKIGDKNYIIEIYFVNELHTSKIPLDLFVELKINESIYDPFYYGSLLIKNENNNFDRIKLPDDVGKIAYDFSSSGDNLIIIRIKDSNNDEKIYFFNIIEETSDTYDGNKVKKFLLVDMFEHHLENNKEVFSSSFLIDSNASQLSNQQRQVSNSNFIKGILASNFGTNIIKTDSWDDTVSKIFKTTNINESHLDALSEGVETAVTKSGMMCFLLKRDNKFIFKGIDSIFRNYIYDKNNISAKVTLITDEYDPNGAAQFLSIPISDYHLYNENSSDTLSNIVNVKSIHYDYSSKTFSFYNEESTISNTISKFTESALNNKLSITRPLGNKQKNNLIYKVLFSTSEDNYFSRFIGMNNILSALLESSTGLNMSAPGILNMETGSFINVDYYASLKNNLTSKLNGGWFVVAFEHTITLNSFTTEIASTKTFSI